ncbi:hypothetical protein DFH07DRAFT_815682 [Mycena maculata]|uniref:Uncharacterized protein n=1 Tax=Mycena maculata TaxID=230809 RepID=A0AAD7JF68_9AGAR|nr:hypothetical protein DFH07DRAFT_815682 [Mycena maculata]
MASSTQPARALPAIELAYTVLLMRETAHEHTQFGGNWHPIDGRNVMRRYTRQQSFFISSLPTLSRIYSVKARRNLLETQLRQKPLLSLFSPEIRRAASHMREDAFLTLLAAKSSSAEARGSSEPAPPYTLPRLGLIAKAKHVLRMSSLNLAALKREEHWLVLDPVLNTEPIPIPFPPPSNSSVQAVASSQESAQEAMDENLIVMNRSNSLPPSYSTGTSHRSRTVSLPSYYYYATATNETVDDSSDIDNGNRPVTVYYDCL